MRFRLCCTCDKETVENNENSPKTVEAPSPILPQATSNTVISQQPKNVLEPIQLDKITEVCVEESSVQKTEEEQPPIQQPITQQPQIRDPPISYPRIEEIKQDPKPQSHDRQEEPSPIPTTTKDKLYHELLNLIKAERSKQQYIPPVTQPYPPVNQTSNISVDTTIGGEKLTFSQIAPDIYQGTFKGFNFYIIQGSIHVDNCTFDENDKADIKNVYNTVMESMQIGIQKLRGEVPSFNVQDWNPTPGSTMNTKYVRRNGENAVMTFIVIGKGHFRSTYEGQEFTILNGRLLTTDGSFDEQDRELILQAYNNTLIGMQQGMVGMRTFAGTAIQGGNVRSVAVGGNDTAYASTSQMGGSAYARAVRGVPIAHVAVDDTAASYNVLATGRETLKRMRSMDHGKRISLLDGGLMTQPRQPVMVIEDISKNPKKPCYFDAVDGGTLAEPVLQKTTFSPQAIIYDDPKTYEKQDKNELAVAKPLDEYIISVDENFNSTNRYHFHKARPKRVIRRKLNPKEKFRVASPERYCLFERECLTVHNQYRKMHGVPPLVHNEFLSQVAKEWAEHLALKDAFYHRPNNEYGENLYYVDRIPCHAKMAVKAWYDEIHLYDYDNPKFSKEVGHFTQLVWKDTREVGTGVAQIGDKVWVCCNYHPPGNYSDKLNDEFVPRPVMKFVKRS